MIFKFSKEQLSFLTQTLSKENSVLYNYINYTRELGNFIELEMDEDIASELRDWAGEKLQEIGFDEDYKLNKEGKILEDLVDVLYV